MAVLGYIVGSHYFNGSKCGGDFLGNFGLVGVLKLLVVFCLENLSKLALKLHAGSCALGAKVFWAVAWRKRTVLGCSLGVWSLEPSASAGRGVDSFRPAFGVGGRARNASPQKNHDQQHQGPSRSFQGQELVKSSEGSQLIQEPLSGIATWRRFLQQPLISQGSPRRVAKARAFAQQHAEEGQHHGIRFGPHLGRAMGGPWDTIFLRFLGQVTSI